MAIAHTCHMTTSKNHLWILLVYFLYFKQHRNFSTSGSSGGGGAGFFQRLSSFIVGAGVSALFSQYYIYNELVSGNEIILKKQKAIEKRLSALEK